MPLVPMNWEGFSFCEPLLCHEVYLHDVCRLFKCVMLLMLCEICLMQFVLSLVNNNLTMNMSAVPNKEEWHFCNSIIISPVSLPFTHCCQARRNAFHWNSGVGIVCLVYYSSANSV